MTQQVTTPTAKLPRRWGHIPQQPVVSPAVGRDALKNRKIPTITPITTTDLKLPLPATLPSNPSPNAPSLTDSLIGAAGNGQGIGTLSEQARALRYSIDLFYEYVHNIVEYIPTYGLSKGGLGALVESSGNAFDQCDLMVKLCNQADAYFASLPAPQPAAYNARYVIGEVQLTQDQWSSWLGVATTEIGAALNILGNGGISASSNPDNSLDVSHCWVIATINGQDYAFDPALKSHTLTTGIDLAAAMQYVRSGSSTAFIDRSQVNAILHPPSDPNSVQSINAANINADLTTYTMNLIDWIKNSVPENPGDGQHVGPGPGATFDQILGGSQIDQHYETVRNLGTLPYQLSGTLTTNVIPDNYRTLFTILFDTSAAPTTPYLINLTFRADELYGLRTTLFFATNGVASLRINGTVYGTSSALAANTVYPCIFSVTHPYAHPENVPPAADQTSTSLIRARNQHYIGTAFGISAKQLADIHQQNQNIYIAADYAATSEELLGTSLGLIWDNFVGQSSNGMEMLDRMGNTSSVLHHLVGTVINLPKPTNATVKIKSISGFLAGFSTAGNTADTDVHPTALATSMMIQSLEGAATEQVTGKPSADAIRITSICNQAGTKIYDANVSNWNTGNSNDVRPKLSAGWGSVLSDMDATIAETNSPSDPLAPWRLIIPNNPQVAVGTFTDLYGYTALGSDGNSVITTTWFGAKGAVSADGQDEADTATAAQDNARQVNGFGIPAFSASESLQTNLSSGRFEYSSQDLIVGNQDAPYSLAFSRYYNSGSRLTFGGFGFGWSHNWQMSVGVNSNGFIPFGDQQPAAAASTIASLYVLRDVIAADATLPVENFVALCEVGVFMINLLANNVVRLQIGASTAFFTLMPDGSYLPAMGMHGASKLVKNPATGAFTYTTSDGIVHTFDTNNRIVSIQYPFGTPTKFTLAFTYSSGRLAKVTNGYRALNFTYDTNGQLTGVNDGNSRTVKFTIDSTTGNLTSVKDPLGNATSYSYDQRGRLTQIAKPANPTVAVITNVYDSLSRVMEQHDAFGSVWQYFVAGSRSEELGPDGNSRVKYYNGDGNVIRITSAVGQVITNTYDGNQRVMLTTAPEGNSVACVYDADGNRISTVLHRKPGSDLADITTTYSYESVWNKLSMSVDAIGGVTTFVYGAPNSNGASKLTSISKPSTSAGTPTASYTYTSNGQVASSIDAVGLTTDVAYDPATYDILSTTVDKNGKNIIRQFTYDAVGNIATVTNELGETTSFTYDLSRRLLTTTSPAPENKVLTSTYDANGNVVQIVMQTGPAEQFVVNSTYDVDGKILTSQEADANSGDGQQPAIVSYFYDVMRRLNKTIDMGGNRSEVLFDAVGRTVHVISNDVPRQYIEYTLNGQVQKYIDEKNNATVKTYDGFDREIRVDYPDGSYETTVYDAINRISQVTQKGGTVWTFNREPTGQLISQTSPGLPTISLTHDLGGRLLTIGTPAVPGDSSSGVYSFGYDTAGRMISETTPDGSVTTVQLDVADQVTGLVYPDAQQVVITHDADLNFTSVSGFTGTVSWAYDSSSKCSAIRRPNGVGQSFKYDVQGNLIATTIGGLKNGSGFGLSDRLDFAYKLDASGFVQSLKSIPDTLGWEPTAANTSTYGAANAVNQYPSVDGANFSYDANGNLTADGINTYSYDSRCQLIQVVTPTGTISYRYDPLGRLAERLKGDTKRRYLYAGLRRIAEYDENNVLLKRFVYGPGLDECVYVQDVPTGQVTYLHYDDNNTPVLFTDESGNVVGRNVFDPWGRLISGSLTTIDIGFQGQIYDVDAGIYNFKARFYNPRIGRYMQQDVSSYINGSNLYNFCNNNPNNFGDPSGLDDEAPAPTLTITGAGTEYNVYNYNTNPQNPYDLSGIYNGTYNNSTTLNGGFSGGGGGGGNVDYSHLLNEIAMEMFKEVLVKEAEAAASAAMTPPAQPVQPPPPSYLDESVADTSLTAGAALTGASGAGATFVIGTLAMSVGGGLLLGYAISDLPKAAERIRKNWAVLFAERRDKARPSNHGNSWWNINPFYVYTILEIPKAPFSFSNFSGVFKFGIAEKDPGYTRMNNQPAMRPTNRYGLVLFDNVQGKVAARAIETSLIQYYRATYGNGTNRPPGNLQD